MLSIKKASFYLILFLLVIAVTELMAYLFFVVIEKKNFSYTAVNDERRARLTLDRDILSATDTLALHPYVGYVFDPEAANQQFKRNGQKISVSALGFAGNLDPFFEKATDNFVVAITGGSVAFQYVNYYQGLTLFTEALKRQYPGKTISVLSIANGGYKQPQQFVALSYLFAMGAHFDMVVNLDGFNEVVLPVVEQIPKKVNPFYPRSWFKKVAGMNDTMAITTAGKIAILREKQLDWARVSSTKPLSYSITANLVWRLNDTRLTQKIGKHEFEFQSYRPDTSRFEVTGPAYKFKNEDQLYRGLVEVWKNSSLQMHRLCAANGVPYYHFLQPNQYVEGSKPMGSIELETAFKADHMYRDGVIKGYPYLKRAGQELQAAGVNFYDLTMIFENHEEPLYSDACCHLGPEGNEVLGQSMADSIVSDIANKRNGAEI